MIRFFPLIKIYTIHLIIMKWAQTMADGFALLKRVPIGCGVWAERLARIATPHPWRWSSTAFETIIIEDVIFVFAMVLWFVYENLDYDGVGGRYGEGLFVTQRLWIFYGMRKKKQNYKQREKTGQKKGLWVSS